MYYLEYKYFKGLKTISSAAPEYFAFNNYVYKITPQILNNNELHVDPFSNNHLEHYLTVVKKTFFLKGGEIGENVVANFYDIRNKEEYVQQTWSSIYSNYGEAEKLFLKESPYHIPQKNITHINEILFYDKILDLFSKHYGNPYGMLWLYMWSKQLNLNISLQNIEHVEGLAFIDGLKESLGLKVKLLTYGVFNEERYHKIKNFGGEKWEAFFNPIICPNIVEEKRIEHHKTLPYIADGNSKYSAYYNNSNKPTAFILTENPEIITNLSIIYNSEKVWVEPSERNVCMECNIENSPVEAVKPVHLDTTFFLCKNCVEKFNYNNECLTKTLAESPDFEHQMLAAKSLYANSNTLQALAFSESPRIRQEVFLNPNADDVVKTAVKLQT
jgi:hypothetical protein